MADEKARPSRRRREALARWDDEGGAELDGPQVPGVGPMEHIEPTPPPDERGEGESRDASRIKRRG